MNYADAIGPDKVGFICSMTPRRLGARAFMTFLEYRHFPPGTPANDNFQLFQVNWGDAEFQMLDFLVVIPKAKEPEAKVIMAELGLRAADGVPTMLGGGSVVQFPVNLPNVFNLEHVRGHFAYKNDETTGKTAEQAEDEACDLVMDQYLVHGRLL